jgi:phage terminase small subunit
MNRTETTAPALSERQRKFVEAYMGAAAGNATKAARLAGYSAATARKQGSRLGTKGHIRAAIEARTKEDPAVWTREDRQRFWTAVASGTGAYRMSSLRDRLRASELLGKSQADFVERVEHSGKVTLEQVLGASRSGVSA